MRQSPRIWVLLGHRKGDNSQLLALAQGLGLPFETRTLRYNGLRRLPKRLLGRTLMSVLPSARRSLQPPWPDLTLAVGHRSVPVTRFIRRASGGRTRIVQLGNPRLDPKFFDLVISTPQYGLPASDKVVRLPLAMASPYPANQATDDERAFLAALPRPHRLMVIGGPNWLWRVDERGAVAAAQALIARCEADGGTLIAVGSPRTEASVAGAVSHALAGTRHRFVARNMPSYRCLLADADEIHVTADSVSMLSEAIFTGKPVGMIPVQKRPAGRFVYTLVKLGLIDAPKPDLVPVWQELTETGLVGTVDEPRAGETQDPVKVAVDAVRRLLDSA